MDLAEHISGWSKDPSSKIAAVITDKNRRILSMGYNGFPKHIRDTRARLQDRDTKLKYVIHAEANAVYNAVFNGISLDQADIYVYGLPVCSECAKIIIQTGIRRVFITKTSLANKKWLASWQLTKKLFAEAKIDIYIL